MVATMPLDHKIAIGSALTHFQLFMGREEDQWT